MRSQDPARVIVDVDVLVTSVNAAVYTDPTDAAWELLQEAIDPFVDDLRRCVALGAEAAAIETCCGIVVGLYRDRGRDPDAVLGWAVDFSLDAAGPDGSPCGAKSNTRHRSGLRGSRAGEIDE